MRSYVQTFTRTYLPIYTYNGSIFLDEEKRNSFWSTANVGRWHSFNHDNIILLGMFAYFVDTRPENEVIAVFL
jgi:hypothetical protein